MVETCWICGNESDITFHHMLPPALNPLKNIEIPLCERCHRMVHNYYGKHNSRKYLNEVKRLNEQLIYARKRIGELEG